MKFIYFAGIVLLVILLQSDYPVAQGENIACLEDFTEISDGIDSEYRIVRRESYNRLMWITRTNDYYEFSTQYDLLLPSIIEGLYDQDYWIRQYSKDSLAKLIEMNGYLLQYANTELYNDLSVDMAQGLISIIGKSGTYGYANELWVAIYLWTYSPDQSVRWCCAKAYGDILGGSNDDSIVSVLMGIIETDESSSVIGEAIKSLSKAGEKASPALDLLSLMAEHENEEISINAKEAIETIKASSGS